MGLALASGAAHAQSATITDDTTAGANGGDAAATLSEYTSGSSTGVGAGFGNKLGATVKMYAESTSAGALGFALQYTGTVGDLGTDAIVIYIDSKAGGFADTTQFVDNGPTNGPNYGRAAISALAGDPAGNDNNQRCDLTFPTGFAADYAIVIEGGFAGLYTLAAGTDLGTPKALTLTPSTGFGTANPREVTGFAMTDLGAPAGGAFRYFATLLNSRSCFRSNEFQGLDAAPADNIGQAAFDMTSTPETNKFNVFRSYTACTRIVALDSAATQNFDGLASTSTSSTMPKGWFFVETGGNTTYAADNGSTATGNTYSYGTTSATERALGTLRSGSVSSVIGGCFINVSFATSDKLAIAYIGEQWRLGTAGREDRFDFQHSVDASSLSTGTWTDVNTLDFVAPVTAGTAGALDGNATANRTSKSATLDTPDIAHNAGLWIRFNDFDPTGSDDGLAIDDFSMTFKAPEIPTLDFGDAADTYGTKLASDGARHTVTTLKLGAAIDAELDAPATLDATTEGADDDGFEVKALTRGAATEIKVTASGAGKLSLWVDHNHDGDFDTTDRLLDAVDVVAGVNTLNVTVPAGASFANTIARFRLSTAGTSSPIGLAADGEVEDYVVSLVGCGDGKVQGGEACDDGDQTGGDGCSATCTEEVGWACSEDANLLSTCACDSANKYLNDGNGLCQRYDFGDIGKLSDGTDSYDSKLPDGARHAESPTAPLLGAAITYELDGLSAQDGLGDTDDAFATPPSFTKGDSAATFDIPVDVSDAYDLAVYIDYDRDGLFEVDELFDLYTGTGLDTVATVTGSIPSNASVGNTAMRLRIASTLTGLDHKGRAADGEVEDYVVAITGPNCGNGQLGAGEQCDDNDSPPAGGDGCDENCQIEANWTCDNDPMPSVCAPLSDLQLVSMAVTPTTVYDSATVSLVTVIRNNGPRDATDVLFTIDAPTLGWLVGDGVPVTDPAAGVLCDFDANDEDVECLVTTLESGNELTVTASYLVVGAEAPSVTFSVASITSDSVDPDTENNDGSVSLNLLYCGDSKVTTGEGEGCDDGNATAGDGCTTCDVDSGWGCTGEPSVCKQITDVTVGLAFGATSVYAGDSTTLTATVANVGNFDTTNVVVTLPKLASLTYGTLPAGCTGDATNVTCTVANLVKTTGTASFAIPVTVLATVKTSPLTHTASVVHDRPDPSNNSGSANLTVLYCGDGVETAAKEACDSGANNSSLPNACRADCTDPVCGDGVVDTLTEACDDDDTDNGDGCSSTCAVETDWACVNPDVEPFGPSVCSLQSSMTLTTFAWQTSPIYAGASSNLRFQVSNAGPGNASQVTLKIERPAALTLGTLPAGCSATATEITCGLGTINKETSSSLVSIPFTAPASLEQSPVVVAALTLTQNGSDKNPSTLTQTASLVVQYCGDGSTNGAEECDEGNTINDQNLPNRCRSTCQAPGCGDGVVDTQAGNFGANTWTAETCDDGDGLNTDDCPDGQGGTCKVATCGDGFVDAQGPTTEGCDDGNQSNADDCPSGTPNGTHATCQPYKCGDGYQHTAGTGPFEGCDDGDGVNTDNCPDGNGGTCQPNTCGDGFLDQEGANAAETEGCDDGNTSVNDACPSGPSGTCDPATCGDGFVNFETIVGNQFSEECDQGGGILTTGDGCDATCDLETGFTCKGGTSSTCDKDCRSFYDFTAQTVTATTFPARVDAGVWAYGLATNWNSRGWATGLSGNLPGTAVKTRLQLPFQVPTTGQSARPRLKATFQVDFVAGDCFNVYVTANTAVGTATPVATRCNAQTGTQLFEIDLASFAGQGVIASFELASVASGVGRKGVLLRTLELASDSDNDSLYEVKGLTCTDPCVDRDTDGWGHPTSGDRQTCTKKTADDCNDDASSIKPEVDETACANDVDDNCDGATDEDDPYCFEICGDFIDNSTVRYGGAAQNLADCADPACNGGSRTADAFCAKPCLYEWDFSTGAIWAEDLGAGMNDIFNPPTLANKFWTTGSISDATRKVGRLHLNIPAFGNAAARGPNPKLTVDFALTANTIGREVFAVCIDNKTCLPNSLTDIFRLAETTAARQVATIDLTPYLGRSDLDITFLFDTVESTQANPANVRLDIFNVRLGSDIDGDLAYEGPSATCDKCWDGDGDGWGSALSPDIKTCSATPQVCTTGSTAATCVDCDDGSNLVNPGFTSESICGDQKNNDCDFGPGNVALTDALDPDCGSEDCANGMDDNGDGNIDCADATCANDDACDTCHVGYDFERGDTTTKTSAGFVPVTAAPNNAITVFEWGTKGNEFGGAAGWWTVIDGAPSTRGATGTVRATLSKTGVTVFASAIDPAIELVYDLKGSGVTIGLCYDVAASLCGTANAANVVWSTTQVSPSAGTVTNFVNRTYRGTDGLDHAVVPVARGTRNIVIFYEGPASSDGLYLGAVRARSDVDLDGAYERSPDGCDHCVDIDKDGYGDPSYAIANISECTFADQPDCDDRRLDVNPGPTGDATETCYQQGGADTTDNDCDGLLDSQDPDCVQCGNNIIEQGETCDPPGSGCSASCQVQAGGTYLSEVHLPSLYGNAGEQWIELFNKSATPIDFLDTTLELRNSDGVRARFSNDPAVSTCIVLTRTSIGATAPGPDERDSRFFVVAFGPELTGDFLDTTRIDAICPGFYLDPTGDVLTVTLANNPTTTADDTAIDAFDFSGDAFACHRTNIRRTVGFDQRGRSLVLRNATLDATGFNPDANDLASNWCLAGLDAFYSNTGNHFGSPGTPGTCAEVLCDGVDDNCDGDVNAAAVREDEANDLSDLDDDGYCDEQDCEPTIATCTAGLACFSDGDGDGTVDCQDSCEDFDQDCFGERNGLAGTCADRDGRNADDLACADSAFDGGGAYTEDDLCDNDVLINPLNGETSEALCTNGVDDDCDQLGDCRDSTCGDTAICAGETCGRATVVGCGFTTSIAAVSNDFLVCDVGQARNDAGSGPDAAFRFIAPSNARVTFQVDNLGTRRHELALHVGQAGCSETSCANVVDTEASGCGVPARLSVQTVQGQTYTIVAKSVGACNLGPTPAMRFTVVCSEVCGPNGVDEDADGAIDCADVDCAGEPLCASLDPDGDGFTNAQEAACQTNPADKTRFPSADDVLDLDNDQQLNCVDLDDDGDKASDATEVASCLDAGSKNDAQKFPTRDLCTGASCGPAQPECCTQADPTVSAACRAATIDANCNELVDTTEFLCGTQEDNCGDLVDNDGDGAIDCGVRAGETVIAPADRDCVYSTLCGLQDFDGDGVLNRVELLCNTAPDDAQSRPNPPILGQDTDGDNLPNCADTDDDGDGYDDVQEVLCGSDPLIEANRPPDLDLDQQCDDVDPDDDGDTFDDTLELNCSSDPRLASSTPVDTTHDLDGDSVCNNFDEDDDGDAWSDLTELQCKTDPKDEESNPTDLGQDIDNDRLCDLLDSDDDNDGWSDIDEQICGNDPNLASDLPTDTDSDRVCNEIDTDDDNDGVDDLTEAGCFTNPEDPQSFPIEADAVDTNVDGEPNCIDTDDDGDGVSDANEALLGSNRLLGDSDEDGIPDGTENKDKDGVVDEDETSPISKDSDDDRIDDLTEAQSSYPTAIPNESAPTFGYDNDTDGDGLRDGQEDTNLNGRLDPGETNPVIPDSDGDGVVDGEEVRCATNPLSSLDEPTDKDKNGECDNAQLDTDGDGIADGVEVFCGTVATDKESTPSLADLDDTDGDGDINCIDGDDDDDLFTDVDEGICGTKPRDGQSRPTEDDVRDYDGDGTLNCADADQDDDGVSNADEARAGTDPQDRDSDDDGLSEGREKDLGTNPLSVDTDNDGMQDGTELGLEAGTVDTDAEVFIPDADPRTTTNPRIADTDNDGVVDGEEDFNKNGAREDGEGDPLNPVDGLADTDGDGLIDRDEVNKYDTDPNSQDTDGDALNDKLEVDVYFTDPKVPDTDKGGVQDGFEVDNGTDPLDATDDYRDADVSGDNVFGCGGAQDAGLIGLALLVLGALVVMRRRKA